jgi:hypothetical protein
LLIQALAVNNGAETKTNSLSQIAGIVEKTAKNYIYLNGEREATETITMESCNGDLILGSNNAYSNNFDGAMDETRIWTVARSQEEIEQNMGLQVSATDESDLLIYYTY